MTTPSADGAVQISLDLRGFADRRTSADGLLELWAKLHPLLTGAPLRAGEVRHLEPEAGKAVGVRVLAVPAGLAAVAADTPFAVFGVRESPAVKWACGECKPPAARRYGPLSCAERACHKPLCDEHAVVLDGRLLAFCPAHRPTDPDGVRPATFWCAGRDCRQGRHAGPFGRAWAGPGLPHPNAPATWYCRECYADTFPPCTALGCKFTGSNECEYVDPATGRSCRVRRCNRDIRRWQVFGAHEDGLRLCAEHSRTSRLTDAQVVFQVAAATAARTLRFRGAPDVLPSLKFLRYTLQNTTGRKFDLAAIHDLFLRVTVPDPDLQRELNGHRADKARHWQGELKRGVVDQGRGRDLFDEVVEKYRELGFDEVADHLGYSDYSSGKNMLFVTLPEHYRGLFVGTGGANVRAVAAAVGLTKIDFEKLK